ncbi:MAG: hypothetical protein ACOX2L_03805 [Anaerolineae bacterium]|jgi:hypothetical protein|nr:hypothetical protein [Chloroflexota bacterium]
MDDCRITEPAALHLATVGVSELEALGLEAELAARIVGRRAKVGAASSLADLEGMTGLDQAAQVVLQSAASGMESAAAEEASDQRLASAEPGEVDRPDSAPSDCLAAIGGESAPGQDEPSPDRVAEAMEPGGGAELQQCQQVRTSPCADQVPCVEVEPGVSETAAPSAEQDHGFDTAPERLEEQEGALHGAEDPSEVASAVRPTEEQPAVAAPDASAPDRGSMRGVSPQVLQAPPLAPPERNRTLTARGGWRDMALVLLGGLLGVITTLVILGALSGTLNFASRRLVDALSRNMSTMQANQEMTWAETQSLLQRLDQLERRVAAVEGLDDRLAAMERDSAALSEQFAQLDASLASMGSDLAQVEGALSDQERLVNRVQATVSNMQGDLQLVQQHVTRVNAFLKGLRELLGSLDGAEEGA